MKQKTLYVTDMDGTLLDGHSHVSVGSALMLNKAIAQGALVTVATARTPATAVKLLHGVHIGLPLIVMSGAAWWDMAAKHYRHVQAIAPAVVRAIVAECERSGIHPFVYQQQGDMLHAYHRGAMLPHEEVFVSQRQFTPFKRFHLQGFDLAAACGHTMLVFTMRDYETLVPLHERLCRLPGCMPCLSHDVTAGGMGLLEVYAPGTTKAAAIACLAREVDAERVVAFGDNRNDIAMMRAATVAVAVENAFDEVKAVAHEVIGRNDDDAVARWILADVERQKNVAKTLQ